MPSREKLAIEPEKNEFDDHFLDVVGAAFKFDHAKRLAEWLKNSADAYATTGIRDAEQFIVLRFKQARPKKNSVFECVDFVGMTRKDIDKALKRWGDPKAAKKGTSIATLGGHGNGGKFYMRQMFATSRYVTYRNGLLNVFGFDEKKRYGYARGFVDRAMSLQDALTVAGIAELEIPPEVLARWKQKRRNAGFTVVVGEHPERFRGSATVGSILQNLRLHPQARRLVDHKQVYVVPFDKAWGERLVGPEIEPRHGYEEPREIDLPRRLERNGEIIDLRSSRYSRGKLTLRTSQLPLARGELAALNAIDMLGEVGCIGSYRMHELGPIRYSQEAEFIYGECECPVLEDDAFNSVLNDREKLADNEVTRALLGWIRGEVDSLAEEMADKRRKEQKSRDLRQSSLFNQLLDKWKNRFMPKLTIELFGGGGIGESFGGSGGGGEEPGGKGKGNKAEGLRDKGAGEEGGGGDGADIRKGPAFPRVLLSGFDRDPLDLAPEGPFECDPRHPPVYQRDVDIAQAIYWINTSRPLANRILEQYGSGDPRWREYLFQRYVDIIYKQAIHALGRKDAELTADKVDTLFDDVLSRVQDAAATDLEAFLFEEQLAGSATPPHAL